MGVGVRRTYRVEAIVFQPRLYRPREAAVCLPPVGVAHHIYLPRAVEAEARGLATPLEVVVERKAEERKKKKRARRCFCERWKGGGGFVCSV